MRENEVMECVDWHPQFTHSVPPQTQPGENLLPKCEWGLGV